MIWFLIYILIGIAAFGTMIKGENKGHRRAGGVIFGLWSLLTGAVIMVAAKPTTPATAQQAAPAAKPYSIPGLSLKVAPDAFTPNLASAFSDAVRKLGPKRFQDANELAFWAARYVATSPRCRFVEYVDVSYLTSTKQALIWFVDCTGGLRFRVSEPAVLRFRDAYNGVPINAEPANRPAPPSPS